MQNELLVSLFVGKLTVKYVAPLNGRHIPCASIKYYLWPISTYVIVNYSRSCSWPWPAWARSVTSVRDCWQNMGGGTGMAYGGKSVQKLALAKLFAFFTTI